MTDTVLSERVNGLRFTQTFRVERNFSWNSASLTPSLALRREVLAASGVHALRRQDEYRFRQLIRQRVPLVCAAPTASRGLTSPLRLWYLSGPGQGPSVRPIASLFSTTTTVRPGRACCGGCGCYAVSPLSYDSPLVLCCACLMAVQEGMSDLIPG